MSTQPVHKVPTHSFAAVDIDRQSPSAQSHSASVFIGSEIFRRAAFTGNHPLNIARHTAVVDLARTLGWLPERVCRPSAAASIETLTQFHDRDYVCALQYAETTGQVTPEMRAQFHFGTMENPWFPGLFERAATTVGGSILAARLACRGQVAFHPAGGTHHGRPDRASGFCYFNDPVFALRTMLEEGCTRVLYVDLDAHHGDGVQAAFTHDQRVLTVSIHEENRWPYSGGPGDRGGGNARNFPVPAGFNDTELAYLMTHAILPLADTFVPEGVVICCGADSLAGDPLSNMMLSNIALWQAVAQLIALQQPTVLLGGGGYNPWTLTRYWAGLWGYVNGWAPPTTLPAEAIELLSAMECDLIDEDDIDPAWLNTLVDCAYPGSVRESIRSLAVHAQ